MSRYRFIEAEKAHHPVKRLCRVMKVSRAAYYDWKTRGPSQHALEDAALSDWIVFTHDETDEAYGAPRIHDDLIEAGIRTSRKRVSRLIREANISGWTRKKWIRGASKSPHLPLPDYVKREFNPTRPNQLWVADITSIKTWQGWVHLAVVMDCFSRRIVGWATAPHLRTELVLEALEMAVVHRNPEAGVIHHSDRGTQYTSMAFGSRLKKSGVVQSVGKPATCWDNIVAESFFATLKKEKIYRRSWPLRRTVEMAIFEYIEVFYNRRRRHSTLGRISPAQYEERNASVA